ASFESLCIRSERDPEKHARIKESLSTAHSLWSLADQEATVSQCVDCFISRMGEPELNAGGLKMSKWYEMVSFDNLGELEKAHLWSSSVEDNLYFVTVAENFGPFSVVALIAKLLSPFLDGMREEHTAYTRDKCGHYLARRIGSSLARKDFMANLIDKVESNEMEREELTAHTSTLVWKNHILSLSSDFLSPGVRPAGGEVGIRIYPPGSEGFPLVSPKVSIDGSGSPPVEVEFLPTAHKMLIVCAFCRPKFTKMRGQTSAWIVTHGEANFHDPHTFKPEPCIDPDGADIKEASQPYSWRSSLSRA
ncbi:benzoate 4-monooxygenase cytochrome P450, partial [Penicillium canariense]